MTDLETSTLAAKTFAEHLRVMGDVMHDGLPAIQRAGDLICRALESGNKILICGNGGSAADAQHIAAELVGRYEEERRGWPAIALTTDTSALTALANDYGYEQVFARQVQALASSGDVLIAISTSGNSPNILAAVKQAKDLACVTIALTGAGGGQLASICDAAVVVPSDRTSRVQEAHITIGHLWCELVDKMK
ncbi:MAG TPA: D-sedoheptulose 7-phosphate isomerase [Pyrinomonadaceae bacterium]|jgi:D-sedoheptulose 7-phosphate isomerase